MTTYYVLSAVCLSLATLTTLGGVLFTATPHPYPLIAVLGAFALPVTLAWLSHGLWARANRIAGLAAAAPRPMLITFPRFGGLVAILTLSLTLAIRFLLGYASQSPSSANAEVAISTCQFEQLEHEFRSAPAAAPGPASASTSRYLDGIDLDAALHALHEKERSTVATIVDLSKPNPSPQGVRAQLRQLQNAIPHLAAETDECVVRWLHREHFAAIPANVLYSYFHLSVR